LISTDDPAVAALVSRVHNEMSSWEVTPTRHWLAYLRANCRIRVNSNSPEFGHNLAEFWRISPKRIPGRLVLMMWLNVNPKPCFAQVDGSMNKTAFAVAAIFFLSSNCWAKIAYVPREKLIDQADTVVVGKVVRIDAAGAAKGIECVTVEVKEVLKGDPKLKTIKQLQPSSEQIAYASHHVRVSVGERGVWLVKKSPNGDYYSFEHPAAFVSTNDKTEAATVMEIKKLLEDRAKIPAGPEVKGLVARAELLREGSASIRFSLKNVSDKPIVICDYAGSKPLAVKWIGPDGRDIPGTHYDWLREAQLTGITATCFVTIPPGGVHLMGPRQQEFDSSFLATAPAGENRITISYHNKTVGDEFKIKNVWTGTVSARELIFKK
jgi:hypothetical protein